jgi:hypothetical protein
MGISKALTEAHSSHPHIFAESALRVAHVRLLTRNKGQQFIPRLAPPVETPRPIPRAESLVQSYLDIAAWDSICSGTSCEPPRQSQSGGSSPGGGGGVSC